MPASSDSPRNIVWSHIREIGTCMMVTRDGDIVRARPMRCIPRPEQNAIWFFTTRDSDKDNEAKADPRVCLTYSDPRAQTFVSVSGQISLVDDKNTIADLWSEGAEAYFPGGKDDPSIVLMKVTPEMGEYWDAPSSPIVLAIKFLQAKISGERPEIGVNEVTRLS